MTRGALLSGLTLAGLLAGCQPPPSDAAVARVSLLSSSVSGPSEPLPSPETTDAIWASTANPLRLVYGVPGKPVLLAIECINPEDPAAYLRITRHAPADDGAGALLALIGNGAIGRIEVDSTRSGGRAVWQGERSALDAVWEPLAGPREVTVTVPGAGLVRINPSDTAWELLTDCRDIPPEIEPPVLVPEPSPVPVLSPIP
jgi:hypothetical protein